MRARADSEFMTISREATIRRAPDVRLTRTGGEGVLVDEHRGSVHVVNGAAVRVWELCSDEIAFDDLVEAMARDYEVDDALLRGDLEDVLETLDGLGLVTVSAFA